MNRRHLYALICVSAAIVSYSCGNTNQGPATSEAAPVTVVMGPVAEEIVTGHEQFPAFIVPLKETELRAEVSGYITQIHVADGAQVRAGQQLYEIDPTRYGAIRDQAKANLAIAQANQQRLERDLNRYETLAKKDAIARQVLDNAVTELRNAEAQVLSMEAAMTTAQINLDRSVIRAPFAGVIGISEVRQGALVSAGSTLINTISTVDPIGVDFQVNENDLQRVISLQNAGGGKRDSSISLILADGTNYPVYGSISTIDRAINRNTGTIMVRAAFENPNGILRAGLSAILRIRQTSSEREIVIPYKAVTEQLGQSTVFVVGDSSRVEQRIVQLGMKSGEDIVVQSGLKPGEIIVTDGLLNIRHGSIVTPMEDN